MENRLPRFGENEGTYLTSQPADHSDICWASAIGAAMHVPGSQHGAETAHRAAAMLTDGRAECICTRRRAKRRG